jgi:hypothetical protein
MIAMCIPIARPTVTSHMSNENVVSGDRVRLDGLIKLLREMPELEDEFEPPTYRYHREMQSVVIQTEIPNGRVAKDATQARYTRVGDVSLPTDPNVDEIWFKVEHQTKIRAVAS